MTIVIPLIKHGSRHNDLELKFALRSIEGNGDVVIISDYLPNWLNHNCITLIRKVAKSKKQYDIRSKILAACMDKRVSEDFYFTNDDCFILTHNPTYRYFGNLSGCAEKGSVQLKEELMKAGKPTRHADGHQPIIYNKAKFIEAAKYYPTDCVTKSMYCNHFKIEGEESTDLKLHEDLPAGEIKELIKGRDYFSCNSKALGTGLKTVLEELYPNKSRFEL